MQYFFILVVYMPEKIRKNKIEVIVFSELTGLCYDISSMLMNMYKNSCESDEWNLDGFIDDKDVYNDNFFRIIKKYRHIQKC